MRAYVCAARAYTANRTTFFALSTIETTEALLARPPRHGILLAPVPATHGPFGGDLTLLSSRPRGDERDVREAGAWTDCVERARPHHARRNGPHPAHHRAGPNRHVDGDRRRSVAAPHRHALGPTRSVG